MDNDYPWGRAMSFEDIDGDPDRLIDWSDEFAWAVRQPLVEYGPGMFLYDGDIVVAPTARSDMVWYIVHPEAHDGTLAADVIGFGGEHDDSDYTERYTGDGYEYAGPPDVYSHYEQVTGVPVGAIEYVVGGRNTDRGSTLVAIGDDIQVGEGQ